MHTLETHVHTPPLTDKATPPTQACSRSDRGQGPQEQGARTRAGGAAGHPPHVTRLRWRRRPRAATAASWPFASAASTTATATTSTTHAAMHATNLVFTPRRALF